MTLPSSGSDAPMVDAPRLDDGDAHAVPYAAPVFDCLPLVPPAHCFVHRPAQDLQVRTFTTANALEDTNSKPVAAIVVVKEGSEELTVHADGTPLTVGCHSSKSLSHHRVYKRHLQFAFVDGALTLKALQPGIHICCAWALLTMTCCLTNRVCHLEMVTLSHSSMMASDLVSHSLFAFLPIRPLLPLS